MLAKVNPSSVLVSSRPRPIIRSCVCTPQLWPRSDRENRGEGTDNRRLTFPPTRGRMCIFPVRLSFTDATMRHVPHRITCRSAHLWSCVLPLRTLNTPFRRVRSCWSAFAGRSVLHTNTHTHTRARISKRIKLNNMNKQY